MKNSPAAYWIINITAFLLILLFVYTGLSKLNDKRTFEIVLLKSPLIKAYATELTYLVPLAELIIAFLLFFPSSRYWGLWAALFIMVLLTLYLGYMIIFSPQLPCSCGGVIKKLSWRNHLLLNIIFIILPALSIKLIKQHQRFIAINRNS